MTFTEVYERLIAHWPEEISIADSSTTSGGGSLFPTLSRVLDQIENRIDHGKDTWGSLMAWTMFQVFHAHAIKLREIGSDALLPRTIDRKIVEEKYYENLHGSDWSEELAAYRRS
jgi:hypothetical protein